MIQKLGGFQREKNILISIHTRSFKELGQLSDNIYILNCYVNKSIDL